MSKVPIKCHPEFVDLKSGRLFSLKVSVSDVKQSKAVIFIPPFAEEMNKSRKMMKSMLEATGQHSDGFLFDLFGTGDSEGHLANTSWDSWKQNLGDYVEYVVSRGDYSSIEFVCLRTGSLLLNDWLNDIDSSKCAWSIDGIHYWNPVVKAQQFVTQFLRLKLAAEMMRSDGDKRTTKDLMAELQQNGQLEVAGYMLNNVLIEEMLEARISLPECYAKTSLFYYDVSGRGTLTPAISNAASSVRKTEGYNIDTIKGLQFWSTQEISMSEELLLATKSNVLRGEVK
jgi:exosortase A-associated hydrolase 2